MGRYLAHGPSRALNILAAVSIVVAAVLARPVLLPMLFALLLAMVLWPIVVVLKRARVPTTLAAGLVLTGVVGGAALALTNAAEPLAYWSAC
ncbi:MAG: hypothetical protein R3E77_06530 [Steroidobacteraceae bacterium]